MLRLASDENFNGDIVRGLLFRLPELNLVRVQDVGLEGAIDPAVLTWAAENDRIILTHDRATLPKFAYERVEAGDVMPGVFVVNDRLPVGRAIEELVLVATCSEASEWVGEFFTFHYKRPPGAVRSVTNNFAFYADGDSPLCSRSPFSLS